MTLYNSDMSILTEAEELAFYEKWALDGKEKPRIKTVSGKNIILTAVEINNIEAEWKANAVDWKHVKIDETEYLADSKVLNILPEKKQRYLTAEGLILIRLRSMGTALTPEQVKKEESILAEWNKITPIRDAEELIKAEISVSTTPESFDVAGSTKWP